MGPNGNGEAMVEYKSLSVTRDEHVTTVELIGPGRGNAMGPDFWAEMPLAFAELDRDEATRVVVVRGRGEHFTYGLDLKATAAVLGPVIAGHNLAAERAKLRDLVLAWQRAFGAIADCRKPVIAAIDGWCIGGGVNLIAACDVRLCTAAAKFSLREPRIAIVPDVGALQRLPKIIGEGATRLMAFTAGDFDADWALSHNLVEGCYADRAALDVAVAEYVTMIAANSPLAVQGTKQVLEFSKDATTAASLQFVATWNSAFLQSNDLQEAMTAFMQGRPPEFRGT